ncbi:prolipoprotein diacylglyceryl transferase [Mycobacterium sp.]|uniref:prolipoprotein diacylglyceryl transferase n=1 Tax=Mycobacterium sp. TaxID=1785 RepID=UPI002BB40AD1|nr:prolipoprotein diacylglyceryl transferase [Mycobacterium sp.]HKP44468.1 prolipoprotein diacylglyceryl transferase [Mycobacterium sp.]
MTTTVLAYIPSPSQGVWHIGVVPIRAYALFIIVGIVVALVLGDRRWAARGGEPGVIYDIALWAVPFGLIGGRLYHVITDWRTYFGEDGAGLAGAFRIWDGGLGIWGAVALGGVGAWIGCRSKGIPLPAFGDAIAPGIILAQAIGRIGNYFNQELFGRPTTLPWGLQIYERRDASGVLDNLNGVSTGQVVDVYHPTFLYELLWNLLVFAALIYLDRRFKIGHGRLFAIYVAGYCLGRFWIELMRSDVATHIAGIRINSFTSTFVFIGAVVYVMVAPKGREDPASLRGTPKEAEEREDTAVEEFVKELTTVGATSGVVAAAKAAGEAEDEDAKAVAGDETETKSEAAGKAEELAYDVAEPPSEDIEEAEEFAAEGDEEAEPESEAAEAEAAAPETPSDEGGVGAIEPEEAAEAEAAAPEAHEAAVEAAEDAQEAAAEAAEEQDKPDEPAEDVSPALTSREAEIAKLVEEGLSNQEIAERLTVSLRTVEGHLYRMTMKMAEADGADQPAGSDEAEPVAGVGAVEGEDAEDAQEAAPEAHEAAVEATEEAEAVAEEVASEAEESEPDESETQDAEAAVDEAVEAEPADEPDEPDTEDAEAAVGEAVEAEPSEEEAAEAEEAVVEEADAAADEEPSTGVLETQDQATVTIETVSTEPAPESRRRLGRWLRRNR